MINKERKKEWLARTDRHTMMLVERLAEKNKVSINKQVNLILAEYMQTTVFNPCVVKDGSRYYAISPIGVYTELDHRTFIRFTKGNIPYYSKTWEDVFDSYDEAVNSIGTIVCEWTHKGLVVRDVESFVKLYNAQ